MISLRYPITVSGFLRQHPQTQSLQERNPARNCRTAGVWFPEKAK
jgi:hypothetical protein